MSRCVSKILKRYSFPSFCKFLESKNKLKTCSLTMTGMNSIRLGLYHCISSERIMGVALGI